MPANDPMRTAKRRGPRIYSVDSPQTRDAQTTITPFAPPAFVHYHPNSKNWLAVALQRIGRRPSCCPIHYYGMAVLGRDLQWRSVVLRHNYFPRLIEFF